MSELVDCAPSVDRLLLLEPLLVHGGGARRGSQAFPCCGGVIAGVGVGWKRFGRLCAMASLEYVFSPGDGLVGMFFVWRLERGQVEFEWLCVVM